MGHLMSRKIKNLPLVVVFQNILKWVNPFYPNSMLIFFFEIVLFDNFSLGIFDFLFTPLQVNWANLSDFIMFLNVYFSTRYWKKSGKFSKKNLLTVSSISTRLLGAEGLEDRLLANDELEAFFPCVDFLAFPAIFFSEIILFLLFQKVQKWFFLK